MEVQLQASGPRRLLFFLICFFSGLATCRSAVDAPPTLIDSLPGFDGALPFRLETGYVPPTPRTHLASLIDPAVRGRSPAPACGRYVTVDEENGGELFYYFIESEGDPRRDPLLLWLPGGDRCTVLQALLLQLGQQFNYPRPQAFGRPIRSSSHPAPWLYTHLLFPSSAGPLRFVLEPYNETTTVPRLHHHPYSWTKAASVLFLDSPVGAGFSFSRNPKGYDVGEVSSSLQVKTFLTKVTLGLVDMSYYYYRR
jgi:serine carboxypeptidase-like clade 1